MQADIILDEDDSEVEEIKQPAKTKQMSAGNTQEIRVRHGYG